LNNSIESLAMIKESLEKFSSPIYGKIQRSSATYQTVAEHCRRRIESIVAEYQVTKNDQQLLREIRNDIDYYLRRYHQYCIKERSDVKAHYHEQTSDLEIDFEHLIPAARIRDLLLANVLTVDQAFNAPTVRLSRAKHLALKDAGWASHTPDIWLPFLRYSQVFDGVFETYDGTIIDPKTWTLERHYDYFKHLTF